MTYASFARRQRYVQVSILDNNKAVCLFRERLRDTEMCPQLMKPRVSRDRVQCNVFIVSSPVFGKQPKKLVGHCVYWYITAICIS